MTDRLAALRTRAVSAGRAALVRASVVDALPPGPSRPLREVRARALLRTDPAAAARTLAPLLETGTASPGGWRTAVTAAERRGDDAAVVDLARRAAAAGVDDPAVLERAVEAVGRRGSPADRAEVLDLVARAGRGATGTAARRLGRTLAAAELEHAHGGPDEPGVRRRVLDRPGGRAALVDHLRRHEEWDALAELVDGADATAAADPGDLDHGVVAKAALRAAARGYVTAAARLGRAAQRLGDTTSSIDRLLVECEDQLAVLAHGWSLPAPERSTARPADGHVLSVLGQSLPLRNGGYATRSHGILTSLAARGWDMAAVTKYGFPYDFWPAAAADREVAPVDVVDAIPYHRNLTPGVTSYPRYPLAEHVVGAAPGIVRVAREHGASLVHAASLFDVGLAGARAADALGLPFVYEMRGLKQLLEGARFPGFEQTERGRYFETVELEVARRADRLLVITGALGELMADLGVDPGVITVVPNGVHTSAFRPLARDAELEQRLGLEGRTVIGYVGGFVHYEGLELLLRAADLLRRERSDFHVLVVGDGAHASALEAEARRLGLDGDVLTMPGRVPHDEVERWLSLIDITPFPRVPMPVSELISPIKPFEAMATEKTVVVSDVAALTEIVADGVTGRHFAKGDATSLADVLRELLDDPDQRARLGRAARAWVVAERDWSTISGAVDGVYRELVAPPSSSTDR